MQKIRERQYSVFSYKSRRIESTTPPTWTPIPDIPVKAWTGGHDLKTEGVRCSDCWNRLTHNGGQGSPFYIEPRGDWGKLYNKSFVRNRIFTCNSGVSS